MKRSQYSYENPKNIFDGKLTITVDDEVLIEIEQEQAMDSYNVEITSSTTLSLDAAKALAAWLSSVTK